MDQSQTPFGTMAQLCRAFSAGERVSVSVSGVADSVSNSKRHSSRMRNLESKHTGCVGRQVAVYNMRWNGLKTQFHSL